MHPAPDCDKRRTELGHLRRACERVSSCGGRQLGGPDRAQPTDKALVEQRLDQWPVRRDEPLDRSPDVELLSQDVGPEVSNPELLIAGAAHLDHVHAHAHRLRPACGQPHPDLMCRSGGSTWRSRSPGAIHPQVMVQGPRTPIVGQPREHVLPDDARTQDRHPPEVDGGEPRHPQLRARQRPTSQCGVQAQRRASDGITFGHGPIVAQRWRRRDSGPRLVIMRLRPHPRRDPVGPGQESVWDYPRPPALERSAEHVTVVHGGIVVADSRSTWRILETAHAPAYYIPADDVRTDLLVASRTTTLCEYKGRAAHASLAVPGRVTVADACWWYPEPTREFADMRGAICFYPQRVDECTVDGEVVVPLASPFYGDWPTSRIAGPWKGSPGTEWW